jgi:endonuclease/exonuclease/phosphatase family metal-dependent hydrolase
MTGPDATLTVDGGREYRDRRLAARSILILTALSILFGAQCFRVILPSIIWYLEEVLGVSVQQGVLYWSGPFIVASLAPLLVWWLKPRGAFWAAGGGLMLSRLVMEQTWTPQIFNVWAAMAGITAFICMLTLLFGRALAEAEDGAWPFVAGLLLGLSLDTALRGLTGTVDLLWTHGLGPRLVVIGLIGLYAWVLWDSTRNPIRLVFPDFRLGLPLLGLGFFLFIQWVVLQSQGWIATFSGWPPGAALAWIVLGNVGALLAAGLAASRRRAGACSTLLAGAALILALVFDQASGLGFALAALVGLISAGWLLAVIFGAGQPLPHVGRSGRMSLAVWLGLLAFALLVVIYSISFVVQLPFPSSALEPLAGAGLAVCALAAAMLWRRQLSQPPAWRAPVSLGAALLLAPLVLLVTGLGPTPPPLATADFPFVVLTYNIRDGFGMNGRQDLEAIAQVIEGSGAQVVALQEVGRGSLLESGADVLGELSQRLNMPYFVMETATSPTFGDAILSRFPIRAGGQASLPRLNALIGRGYGWAQIHIGNGAPLFVVTSHLDSGEGARGSTERTAEVDGLAAAWATRPRVLILGDMNSHAGSPEMQAMLRAGLIDTWAEAGQGQRPAIDWIFHTPDLRASDAAMIDSQASDHFAVTATIDIRR